MARYVSILAIEVLILSVALLSGCGGDKSSGKSGDSNNGGLSDSVTGFKPHACPQLGTLCEDECAETMTDVNNCGRCGRVCPEGQICSAGACVQPCDGRFTLGGDSEPIALVAGSQTRASAAGDFDGDGDLDFVAASDGSFQSGTQGKLHFVETLDGSSRTQHSERDNAIKVAIEPHTLLVADFDDDDMDDLVVVGRSNSELVHSISIVPGALDFPSGQVNVSVGGAPQDAFISDVDSDGDLDLVVQTKSTDGFSYTILAQEEPGEFGEASTVLFDQLPELDQSTVRMIGADINDDGVKDIVLYYRPGQTQGQLAVYLADSVGGFEAQPGFVEDIALETDRAFGALGAGDIDGDGITDIALVTAHEVLVYLASGDDALLGEREQVAEHHDPPYLQVGDLDGDGRAEIIAPRHFAIYQRQASGEYVERVGPVQERGHLNHLFFEPDERNLLITTSASLAGPGYTVRWRLESPRRGPLSIGDGITFGKPILVDLDGDGQDDIVAATAEAILIYRWRDGLVDPVSVPRSVDGQIEVGDLDGDGRLDLVLFGHDDESPKLVYLRQQEDGSFASIDVAPEHFVHDESAAIELIALLDLDGRGRHELITSASEIYRVEATGEVELLRKASLGSRTPRGIASTDINADGYRDLLWGLTGHPYLGSAEGSFTALEDWQFEQSGLISRGEVLATDFDADGGGDLLAWQMSLPSEDDWSIQVGFGGPVDELMGQQPVSIAGPPAGVATWDYDGDGLVDVALALKSPSRSHFAALQIHPNLDGRTFGEPQEFWIGDAEGRLATGDITGDGLGDLVVPAPGRLIALMGSCQ